MSNRGSQCWKLLARARWIGVLALFLLGHAVAIDTMHRHEGADRATIHAGTSVSSPNGTDPDGRDGTDGCPACQLQQNSTADVARPLAPVVPDRSTTVASTERVAAILQAGDT